MELRKSDLDEIREQIHSIAEKLPIPWKRYCDEYLANGNVGSWAYRSVYNCTKQAAGCGALRLMKNKNVRAYISLCKRFTSTELLDHHSVTQKRVLDEEAKLAFIDPRKMWDESFNMIHPREWPEELARAISGVEVDQTWDKETGKWKYKYKVKFNDKGRSLGRLESVLGMNKAGELTDKDSDMFKDFLTAIDGKSRGKLPSEMEDDDEE